MSQTKEKSPCTAATVTEASETYQVQDSTALPGCKEKKAVDTKALEVISSIDGRIYFAERLLTAVLEQYFDSRAEVFRKDSHAQDIFVWNYEYMQAQIWAVSDLLFNIRLNCEFFGGTENDPIIAAHIREQDKMRSWLRQG
ncbi:MAG: hypothetical protein ACK5L0_03590 [Candidatus Fimivivens sp.]